MNRILLFALFLFCASGAFARTTTSTLTCTSGSCILTTICASDLVQPQDFHGVVTYSFAWTCTSGGKVLITTPAIAGEIGGVTTTPGSPAPTTLYDLTLADSDGFDVCAGLAANRSATVAESFVPLTGDGSTTNQRFVINGPLTFQALAAGNVKKGTFTIKVIQ